MPLAALVLMASVTMPPLMRCLLTTSLRSSWAPFLTPLKEWEVEARALVNPDFEENDVADGFFFQDFHVGEQAEFHQRLDGPLDFAAWNADAVADAESGNGDDGVGVAVLGTRHFDASDFVISGALVSGVGNGIGIGLGQGWQHEAHTEEQRRRCDAVNAHEAFRIGLLRWR
ncbi:MAG: hypothetical protein KatS3mg029_0447 [Saprospiraceae bacterium]|nr:MAG: hypothetical protein KatS3mg029_0447 [Saprospiraceae bacterium]